MIGALIDMRPLGFDTILRWRSSNDAQPPTRPWRAASGNLQTVTPVAEVDGCRWLVIPWC